MKGTLFAGLGLAGGDVIGDVAARAAMKFGLTKLTASVPMLAPHTYGIARIGIGLFAGPLLTFLPKMFRLGFGAVNVAAGIASLTSKLRTDVTAKLGLGDWELADWETAGGGVGAVPYGMLSDWETADGGVGAVPYGMLGGDYSDQDYYGNYG